MNNLWQDGKQIFQGILMPGYQAIKTCTVYFADLLAAGWEVQRFWEKEVQKSLDACLEKIVGFIKSKEREGFSH